MYLNAIAGGKLCTKIFTWIASSSHFRPKL
jgi:hypothetical protein